MREMKKNHKIGLLVAALVVAVPLILISTIYQGSATSERPKEILIDFSVDVGNKPMVAARGKTVEIPIRIEAPNAAEKTLSIRLAPERGNIDPDQLDIALSKTSVVLSKNDIAAGKVTDLGNGRGIRDVATIAVSPPTNLAPGNYRIAIEVVEDVNTELADGLVSGAFVFVEVK